MQLKLNSLTWLLHICLSPSVVCYAYPCACPTTQSLLHTSSGSGGGGSGDALVLVLWQWITIMSSKAHRDCTLSPFVVILSLFAAYDHYSPPSHPVLHSESPFFSVEMNLFIVWLCLHFHKMYLNLFLGQDGLWLNFGFDDLQRDVSIYPVTKLLHSDKQTLSLWPSCKLQAIIKFHYSAQVEDIIGSCLS